VGLDGEPPTATFRTGLVGGSTKMPDFTAYKVVVLQQPRGKGWLEVIHALRERGTVVIFEVDDWLHAVKNKQDHDFRAAFTNQTLSEYEACMKACDAVIVSTPFLAGVYRHFNKRVFVCRNGIDVGRYQLTRPKRDTVNLGWAGATGHAHTITPWLEAVGAVMEAREATCFVTIGQPFADALKPYFNGRCISTPFAAIEQYPAAMTMIDVAIAPAGKSGFFRAKSDLRWLEAGLLGIPVVANPDVYPDIEHGVTGFHAKNAQAAGRLLLELVDDEELRTSVGQAAREYVVEHRRMARVAQDWRDVFDQLTEV
jgi:glycosyltransferase involved in cell wall biosynthesis